MPTEIIPVFQQTMERIKPDDHGAWFMWGFVVLLTVVAIELYFYKE